MITRQALQGREVTVFESKLTAIGYGFFIPFFFITSGMKFDLDTLLSSAGAMLKVPLFLGMFLIVRGLPALVLYRRILGTRDRMALALLCATELPLVVAITTLAVETGHMRLVDVGGARGRGDDLDAGLPAARAAVADAAARPLRDESAATRSARTAAGTVPRECPESRSTSRSMSATRR